MKNKHVRYITQAGVIAALYAVLTIGQNLLLPGTASMAVQFRVAEVLCVLAVYTPAAIPGLTIGCILFNLSVVGALPWDVPLGGLATLLAAWGSWATRKWTIKGYPIIAILLPAVTNAVLIGWELAVFIGGGFWINAMYVAVGELAVMLTLGSVLYYTIKRYPVLVKR